MNTKVPITWIVDFFQKLLAHEDRDDILHAIVEGTTVKNSHEKGKAFEQWVNCHARGVLGLPTEPGIKREDLIINGWRCQIKHIDEIKGELVSISNMRSVKANAGFRGYLASEIDVFILKHLDSVFVIPCEFITEADGTLSKSIRPAAFSEFIDKWQRLFEPGPHGHGQMDFFG